MRRTSRQINAGGVLIGGDAPISVQSMTNIPAHDFEKTAAQVLALEEAGCDIVRIAVPDEDAAPVFRAVREAGAKVPLVADIHFDYKIALAAIRNGVDKVRINPGNIGAEWKVKEVADACRIAGVPIGIGGNGGSLDKKLLEKYGAPTAEALAESALTQADMLEGFGFFDTVISIKSSTIKTMTDAARIVAKNSTYPIHLGVTEAGTEYSGIIKNSIGVGSLLLDGIGDTIRISLTADPVREVYAGKEILKSLGIITEGMNIISCPTCGRTRIDLIGLAEKFRDASAKIDTKGKIVNVAIMGCVVNGPGEAKHADFGIAGGDGFAVLFKDGQTLGRVEEDRVVETLVEETLKFIG